MFARMTAYQVPVDRMEEAIESVQEQIPTLWEIAGFRGALALADRESGKAIAVSLWDSEEARDRSEELAAQSREEVKESRGEEVLWLERYAVVACDIR